VLGSDTSDLHSHFFPLLSPRPQKRSPRFSIVLKDHFLCFLVLDIATGLPRPVQAPLLADFDFTTYKTRLADTLSSVSTTRILFGVKTI
jgi:hypothetical protein